MILSSPLFITLIINLFINSRHDLNIISLICARSFVAILQNIAMFFLDHMLYNQGSYRKHNLCKIQKYHTLFYIITIIIKKRSQIILEITKATKMMNFSLCLLFSCVFTIIYIFLTAFISFTCIFVCL